MAEWTKIDPEVGCHYYKHIKAQWYSPSGPSPEEHWCDHPLSESGNCNLPDCPIENDLEEE